MQQLKTIMPFFVVEDVSKTIDFHTQKLGFSISFQQTLEGNETPSFCILKRDEISIMFKSIIPDVQPTPNVTNHEWAR